MGKTIVKYRIPQSIHQKNREEMVEPEVLYRFFLGENMLDFHPIQLGV